jgi:hypothetical protein
MVRLVIVGDLQQVARRAVAELGFEQSELDSIYRLGLSLFRRRVLPALESAEAETTRRVLARRGIQALVEMRGIKVRRDADGNLVQITSRAEGPGSERIRVQAIEDYWNQQLSIAFSQFLNDNIDWILQVVRGQRRNADWDWLI